MDGGRWTVVSLFNWREALASCLSTSERLLPLHPAHFPGSPSPAFKYSSQNLKRNFDHPGHEQGPGDYSPPVSAGMNGRPGQPFCEEANKCILHQEVSVFDAAPKTVGSGWIDSDGKSSQQEMNPGKENGK